MANESTDRIRITALKVAVVSADPEADIPAFRLAETLRDDGLDIDFPTTGTIGKKLKKVVRADIKLAIILGGEEMKKNTVQLRNLEDGTQSEIAMADLVGVVTVALRALSFEPS